MAQPEHPRDLAHSVPAGEQVEHPGSKDSLNRLAHPE